LKPCLPKEGENETVRTNGSSDQYLLDTSAVLAWLEGEDGAPRVRAILRHGQALLAWAALLEVHYITLQERGRETAGQRYATLMQLPVTVLWEVSEPITLLAANFKANHRLSFADAVMAATASHHHAILIHKDPEFDALQGQVRLEALPFK
jgi:predicted nucleic acid-binding protein